MKTLECSDDEGNLKLAAPEDGALSERTGQSVRAP